MFRLRLGRYDYTSHMCQENSFILLICCREHLPLLMKMITDYRRKPMQWWNSVSFISQQRETRWIQEVTSHRSHLLFCYKISPTQLARENQLSDHSGWLVVNWHLTITTSCSMANVLLFPKHSKDKHYWRSIKAIREFKDVAYVPTHQCGGLDFSMKSTTWLSSVLLVPETTNHIRSQWFHLRYLSTHGKE